MTADSDKAVHQVWPVVPYPVFTVRLLGTRGVNLQNDRASAKCWDDALALITT